MSGRDKQQKIIMAGNRIQRAAIIFCVLFGCAVASNSLASGTDVSEEVGEAFSAMGEYTIEQKDKAVKKAEEVMDDLDQRIEALEMKTEKKWGKMKMSSREKYNESMRSLRKQRNELSEWYGTMKSSSKDAWKETKKGFSSAYDSIESAWHEIEEDFAGEGKQ